MTTTVQAPHARPEAARPAPATQNAREATFRLLRELGADVVDFGLTATGPELADPAGLADQYTAALIP